jgi:hypothetical protein
LPKAEQAAVSIPLGAHPGRPADERVVVDLPLLYPSDSTYARVPVKIGTRDSLWFLVDLGSDASAIWPRTRSLLAATAAGSSRATGGGVVTTEAVQVDSLRLGGIAHTKVNLTVLDVPTMLHWNTTGPQSPHFPEPDGILGLDLLQDTSGRRYDIEFDFPARRLRLYATTTHRIDTMPTAKPTWAGVRGFVCTPEVKSGPVSPLARMLGGGEPQMVVVTVMINGHPVRALLDTGAPRSYLPTDVAARVGLTPHSPGVTVRDSAVSSGVGVTPTRRYRAAHVPLMLGGASLTPSVVYFQERKMPPGTEMLLGLNAVSDRVLFVATSTREVCLGPRPNGL